MFSCCYLAALLALQFCFYVSVRIKEAVYAARSMVTVFDCADGIGCVVGEITADENFFQHGVLVVNRFEFAPFDGRLVLYAFLQEVEIAALADGRDDAVVSLGMHPVFL